MPVEAARILFHAWIEKGQIASHEPFDGPWGDAARIAVEALVERDIPNLRNPLDVTWWGSECVECNNGTYDSMVCDICHSNEFTIPLLFSAAEYKRAELRLEAAAQEGTGTEATRVVG